MGRRPTRLIAVLATLLLAGCSTTASPPATAGPTIRAARAIPGFQHIYLLIMENRGLDEILSSSKAPYLASLLKRYGLATNYDALTRGSQPNYIALFSGSTQGVADDKAHDLGARNLADEIEASGRTWRVFAENVPLGCFTGTTATGGPDGPGTYARKHEPAISFTDISGEPTRCADITDLSHFDPRAADFELIVPNLCNDMHDCSTAVGDAFLARFVPRILASPDWSSSALFITFDEGSDVKPNPNRVATLVIAPGVRAGMRSDIHHDHYSLLRTIQEAWGLPCLGHACTANDLGEFFAGS